MPADFKKETIDAYDDLNQKYKSAKIVETYGNITYGNKVGSGRAASQIPDSDLMDLKFFIQYSKQKNIDFNYTLNATHMENREFTPEGVREIKIFLRDLYEAGVRSVTAALPSLIQLIRTSGYDFEIKASTLCQITNANKALAYKNMGVHRIVVDESVNRDFRNLRRIREEFGDNVEMIVNPLCLKDCIHRKFHYNEITTDSTGASNDVSVNFYEHRCVLQRNSQISNLLRMCFIRPEDLNYYTNIGIHYFKLQGRHLVLVGDPLRTLKAYFDENFNGDVMDLIYMFYSQNSFRIPFDNKKLEGFLKPFASKEDFCKRDCKTCGYCEAFARKIIDYEKAAEVIQAAENFYDQYDKFNRMAREININENSGQRTDPITPVEAPGNSNNIEVDFDL
jgi:collagenase-like PrtC family protease